MKESEKIAVIDLGTNTFHLLIGQLINNKIVEVHKEKIPVKIGEGGIDTGIITEIALKRGIEALQVFKKITQKHGITKIHATATSAFRNAKNQTELQETIKTKTGIEIIIIDGNEEAQLIYEGVKKAVKISEDKHLIMDIGGGSVEFIICNNVQTFWKGSFEIGGQRLMNRFHQQDPISKDSIKSLNKYLTNKLLSLTEACIKHKPKTLIGASGSFDTLCEIYYSKSENEFILEKQTEYSFPFDAFHNIVEDVVHKNLKDRLAIPGMIDMRANMIVVACLLIEFVVDNYQINKIISSTYALKEGLIYRQA